MQIRFVAIYELIAPVVCIFGIGLLFSDFLVSSSVLGHYRSDLVLPVLPSGSKGSAIARSSRRSPISRSKTSLLVSLGQFLAPWGLS